MTATATCQADAAGARANVLVSVITIFLDAERFLAEAIESVRAQTYRRWELLLVDDGSRDGSAAIAQRYARREPDRIRYITHEGGRNLGTSASRNRGIRDARGELIAFLDADDVYLPEKLERQVALLSSFPEAAMVYGPTMLWYGWTEQPADMARDRLRRLGTAAPGRVHPRGTLPRIWLRRRGQVPALSGALLRRSAVLGVSGFENAFRGMFEDHVLFFKLALQYPVYVDERCYDLYRQHPASYSRLDLGRRQRAGRYAPDPSHLAFLDWLERYLVARGIHDPSARYVIWRERWIARHRRWVHLVDRSRVLGRAARLLSGRGPRPTTPSA